MSTLYLTADHIGTPTGGGLVTHHESEALKSLGFQPTTVIGREDIERMRQRGWGVDLSQEPWCWDERAYHNLPAGVRLAHLYSGTFRWCVKALKDQGAKVVYTIAAHSVEASRREHEAYGIPYAQLYPHLCDPDLWLKYSAGYFAADHIVCPSMYSKETVQDQAKVLQTHCPPITVIPHGCEFPKCTFCEQGQISFVDEEGYEVHSEQCDECLGTGIAPMKPLPKRFTVGYMGAYGPDKGVRYLLEAWKKLNYKDALLILAGRESTSEPVQNLVRQFGGGNVMLRGWVENVSNFYNSLSLYVQPSATEGFGIEVLEAMAHGRPVLCSAGAGAADVLKPSAVFPACDADALTAHIDRDRDYLYSGDDLLLGRKWGHYNREVAETLTWDKIRQRYIQLWQEVLKS